MTDKELKRLSRRNLLVMLLEQSRQMDALKLENERLREEIESRRIAIDEAGTLAEAAMKMSGIFDAAQKAADLYLENVRTSHRCPETDTNDCEKGTEG